MPQLISFASWLSRAEDSWFLAVCEARPDLLRSDTPDAAALAARAATRAAVAAAIESLDTEQLRAVHRAAVAARVDPAVPASTLAAAPGVLTRLLALGLVWPAQAEHIADPLSAPLLRVHAETVGLLPTSAADRAQDIDWLTAQRPVPVEPVRIPAALVSNAQAAAASGLLSEVLSLLDAVDDDPPSQLTSGGVGKRDVQLRARAARLEPEHAVFLLELAGASDLLGVGGSDVDPQWLPTAHYDEFLALPGAEAHARLLTTWLTGTVDTTHVLAGRTGRGERVHALSSAAGHGRLNPYAGFPSALPQLPLLKHLVLAALLAAAPADGAADAGAMTGGADAEVSDAWAVPVDALLAQLRWERPLAAALSPGTLAQVLREAQAFGLVCSPLTAPHAHGLTGFGRLAARALVTAMRAAATPAGYDPALVELGPELPARVDAALPELQTTVLVQSDLTAVAAGPVAPRLHAQLDDIALIEARGQGTVYRFTADSVSRALRRGRSAADVLAFIEQVSSTGVPQPLRFLVEEAAAKLHRVQVAPARAVVVVDRPDDLDPLLADPLLAGAGLERIAPTVALAKVSQDRLTTLLEATGQPIGSHSAGAGPRPRAVRRRHSGAVARSSLRIPADERPAFIAGLLRGRTAAAPVQAGASPLSVLDVLREAQAAGRAVEVTVVGADGARRRLALRPTQITGGRVRGVRQAGGRATEIALAVSRIAAAAPLDPPAGEPDGGPAAEAGPA